MRFLFIIQGEGRGHLTQALTLEEHLLSQGHEVVEVLVGKSKNRELPDFFRKRIHAPVSRFESPNFLPTPANRRSRIAPSIFYNLARFPYYASSIRFINNRIKALRPDRVVNFYELLTGLTYMVCRPDVPCICIGHQYLFLHRRFRFPKVNPVSLAMLKLFTRMTAIGSSRMLALSFRRMPDDRSRSIYVVPPLLRTEAMRQSVSSGNYIHGYMVNSGFSSQVASWHKKRPDVPMEFFWDRKGESTVKKVDETLSFHTLDDKLFLQRMAGCMAYASTAGFESICEAMYMGKPILMVPAHIEQECNAFDAVQSGAGITSSSFCLDRLLDFSKTFRPDPQFVFWANSSDILLSRLVSEPAEESVVAHDWQWQLHLSWPRFKF